MTFKKNTLLPFGLTFLATLSINSYAAVIVADMDDVHNDSLSLDYSSNRYISADGKVSIGQASKNRYVYATKYIAGQGQVILSFTGGYDYGQALDLSADGSVVVGHSWDETTKQRAFKHTDAGGMINLGTLGGVSSSAFSVSAAGDVIVGYSDNAQNKRRGFKYTEATGMVDIGDLGGDNTNAKRVSEDGSTIVGASQGSDGILYAFKYTDASQMVSIHTLGISSEAEYVSADGRVVAGTYTSDQGTSGIFKHTDGTGMVDIGNLGGVDLIELGTLSKDGSAIVGAGETAFGEYHAFKHTDAGGMKDLGTLGGVQSAALAVSANGYVTVGNSDIHPESYISNAFAHTDDIGMINLGAIGEGVSSANGVSDDGMVITGYSTTGDAYAPSHAVIWKLKINDPLSPEPGPEVTLVDVDNTHVAMAKTSRQAYSVLDLHSSRLGALAQQDCIVNAGAGSICIGAFTSVADTKHANQSNVGLNMAYQINDNWRAGLAMDTLVGSSLPDNYKRNSSTTPGMGAFIQYQTQADGTGFNSRLSGSYAKEKLEISRELLAYTEAGKGDADLSGWRGELSFNYGIDVNSVLFTPHVDLVYSQVKRSAYQEDRDAEFKAVYGEMGEKRTSVRLGQKIQAPLSAWATADLDVGVDLTLDRKRDAFTGRVDYIGAYVYDRGDESKYRPYASVGANIHPTKNSAVRVGGSWFKQSYGNDVFGMSLSYSYSF